MPSCGTALKRLAVALGPRLAKQEQLEQEVPNGRGQSARGGIRSSARHAPDHLVEGFQEALLLRPKRHEPAHTVHARLDAQLEQQPIHHATHLVNRAPFEPNQQFGTAPVHDALQSRQVLDSRNVCRRRIRTANQKHQLAAILGGLSDEVEERLAEATAPSVEQRHANAGSAGRGDHHGRDNEAFVNDS
eukprot:5395404-Alexandrium_andersonii.AAC.1